MIQVNVNNLLGHELEATDGVLGNVEDFYFDDSTWTIRYLVVKTGSWLTGRKVLISRSALIQQSWASGKFPVNLTKAQVQNSPNVDTVKTVSREQEEELAAYYSWEPYWGTGFNPGQVWGVIPSTPVLDPGNIVEPEATKTTVGDSHLRSCAEVRFYHIQATNGEIGHVDDFIIDENTWQISYLVVRTHKGFGGKKVLVAVRHIQAVQWDNSRVVVDLNIEAIQLLPSHTGKNDYI